MCAAGPLSLSLWEESLGERASQNKKSAAAAMVVSGSVSGVRNVGTRDTAAPARAPCIRGEALGSLLQSGARFPSPLQPRRNRSNRHPATSLRAGVVARNHPNSNPDGCLVSLFCDAPSQIDNSWMYNQNYLLGAPDDTQ